MLSACRTLFPYLLRYRWRYAAGLSTLAGKSVLAASVPFIIGLVIDELTGAFTLDALLLWSAILLSLALVKSILQYWMRWILNSTSRAIEYDLRSDLYSRLTTLSQKFYRSFSIGDVMSRSTNDMMAVRMMIGPGIQFAADTLLTFAVVLTVMSATDWRLTCLVFLPVPLVSWSVSFYGRRIHDRFRKAQARLSDISSKVQENLTNVRMVRAYVQENEEIERFRRLNDQYVAENLRLVSLWGRFYPLLEVFIGLTYLAVLWYGGSRVINGTLTVGSFVMFMAYMAILVAPMSTVGWTVNLMQRGTAALERLNEILRQQPEIQDDSRTDWQISSLRGDIEFRNVTFRYPGADKPALEKISFEVPAGGKLAILGATGSGKTSLASLIPRLQDPSQGQVLIDGVDVRKIPLAVLRSSIGFVPQEAFLFSETIADNVARGARNPGEWALAHAAETAALAADLAQLPDGFETLVGERGITLSGGQKQRTTLARALVRDPRILVLDDSLSSVDAMAEQRILDRLSVVLRNRTAVIISHRVSTAEFADLILVLDRGRVVEMGTHEQLLQVRGYYFRLREKQLLEEELERV